MYLAKVEKDSSNKISELVESLNGYKRQSEPLKTTNFTKGIKDDRCSFYR